MKVSYSKQFEKDVRKYPRFKSQMGEVIGRFKEARSINQLPNIKKLRSDQNDYRLRIGNFRLGFSVVDETIIFKRFLHRKDIYKYFP